MHSRRILVAGLLALALPALGCVYSHAGPGFIYMDVQGPLGPSDGSGSKEGEACARNYIGLAAVGDATIDTAKSRGGIGEAKTVSYHSRNILGFGTFCTVVKD